MRLNGTQRKWMWQHQIDAEITLTPPTLDQYYTVIDVVGGVKVIFLRVVRSNNEANNQEVDFRVTADGKVGLGSGNLDSGGNYYLYPTFSKGNNPCLTIAVKNTVQACTNAQYGELLEAINLKIEVRQHGALGTAPSLDAICTYMLLDQVT